MPKQQLPVDESIESANSHIPNGWAESLLPEVVYFQEGPGLRKYQYREEGVPFLNIRTIVDGKVDLSLCRFLDTKEVETKYQHFLLEPGDIICSTSGTIGKTAVISKSDLPLMLNTSIIRFRPHDELYLDSRFIHIYLKSRYFLEQALGASTGTAQINVGPTHLKQMHFLLPPRNEQARIVTVIESLQQRSARARALLTEVRPALENLRQSILQAAFSGRLTADWRAKTPDVETAHRLLARIRTERRQRWETDQLANFEAKGKKPPKNWKDKYKEKNLVTAASSVLKNETLPDNWVLSPIGELCDFQQGMQIAKSTRYTEPLEGRLPILRTVSYRNNFSDDVHYVDVAEDSLIANEDDIILSRTGTVGEVLTGVKGVFHNNSFRVNFDSEAIDKEYMRYLLMSPIVQQHIVESSGRTAQPDLTHKAFNPCPFPLAPVKEQRVLVERIDIALNVVLETSQLVGAVDLALEQLDQSILSKAFKGELVPQDPNDEPASELLDRIRATREKEAAEKKATKKKKSKKKVTQKRKS